MTKTSKLKDADEIAADIYHNLRSDDSRLRHFVYAIHQDGTMLFYKNAFVLRYYDLAIIITEHHRYHIYHVEDLKRLIQLERTEIEILNI